MEKKILTVQDISCYGQCSITVALPILSVFGYETAILPSSILSTHTAGFKDFVVKDLSNEMNNFISHWQKEGIHYQVLYTGYLGKKEHIEQVLKIKNNLLDRDSLFVVDPVMGDKGKLYPAFNKDYVEENKRLIKEADIIIPNLTEACLLTSSNYKESYDKQYILDILKKLKALGAKTIILTGVSYRPNYTGVVSYANGKYTYFEHEKIEASYHGTGDIYSSFFIGCYLKTNSLSLAVKNAALFVVKAIKNTLEDKGHFYGVKFEPLLAESVSNIN